MKRIVYIACMIVMVCSLVACKGTQPITVEPTVKPENTAAPETTAILAEKSTDSPDGNEQPEKTGDPKYPVVDIPEEYSAFEEVLSIPSKWYSYEELSANPELGKETTYLKSIKDMETVHNSPEAFYITDDGEIAILDTVGARLCVYDLASGQLKRTVQVGEILDAAPIRAAKSDGVYYVLIPDYNTRIVAVFPDGTTSEIPVPQLEEALGYSQVSEFYVEDGKLILTLIGPSSTMTKAVSLSSGSVSSLYSTRWTLENGTFTVTRGDVKWSFPAEPSSGIRSSRIDVLKVDELGNLYVVQEVPVEGHDDIGLYQVYDKDGRLIHCDRIHYFTDSYLTPEFGRLVGPDGNLYEMYCNEDVVKIMRVVVSN